jgi:nucleoside-diphosphate-sugar epimerase
MRVFVTGATGWIGSAVVPELIGAGHQVLGLARSDASAAALAAAGAEVQRGTLDDLDSLQTAAAASDGVIHTAYKHDIAFSGDYQGAADADLRTVETFGEALAGSDRPFVIASGTAGLTPGVVGTEEDAGDPGGGSPPRLGRIAGSVRRSWPCSPR